MMKSSSSSSSDRRCSSVTWQVHQEANIDKSKPNTINQVQMILNSINPSQSVNAPQQCDDDEKVPERATSKQLPDDELMSSV